MNLRLSEGAKVEQEASDEFGKGGSFFGTGGHDGRTTEGEGEVGTIVHYYRVLFVVVLILSQLHDSS